MLLAINVGNSNTIAGTFAGDSLVSRWRVTTDRGRMADEYAAVFGAQLEMSESPASSIDGTVICSVVPPVQQELLAGLRRLALPDPVVISCQLDLGIEIRYSPPQSLGTDRIANVVAAMNQAHPPIVVVDCGTATNFDVVADDGAYVGGAIAPGLRTSEEALYERTAQLPRVPLEPPSHAIGASTITGLQSGILFGYAGLVDGLVERFHEELSGNVCVIATGGLAQYVAPYSRTIQRVDSDLTLTGCRVLYERNAVHLSR